jgi:hypothetical protein
VQKNIGYSNEAKIHDPEVTRTPSLQVAEIDLESDALPLRHQACKRIMF